MNSNSIVQDQIFFLRHLARLDSNIKVSLDGRSKWFDLYDVVQNPPSFPISARSILKNELVLEIDNDDWTVVRDGTRRILELLNKWGARDCYYLSYSGNRSVHIHLFFDLSPVKISDDTLKVLEGVDKDEIRKEVKAYIMRQVSLATDTSIDLNLSSVRHLIRLEGSVNPKSNQPCSQIDFIPDIKPANYPVKIPSFLPQKLWNIGFLENELNTYLKLHFGKKEKPIHYITSKSTKPIENPERLIEILKPVYIKGFRHFIILSVSGFLKRHQIPLDIAQQIVRELTKKDEEKASRMYSLREVYRSGPGKKIPGLPKLLEIIKTEVKEGKVTREIAENVISQLETIAKGGSEHEAH
ncbi:MAG: hypothetical protein QXV17_14075 [Candidatus Micrarchaeaceae archaeon]